MKLFTNFCYPTEVHDVVKLFLTDTELCADKDEADIVMLEHNVDGAFHYVATFFAQVKIERLNVDGCDELQAVRLRKRYAKIATYNLLCSVTGKQLPWGSLTGIRPTKLAVQLQSEGLDWQKTFVETLGVSQQKTQLVRNILQVQGQHRINDGSADLYLGVPFCVSRCSYCSFTSGELERLRKYVEPYVEALCNDLRQTIDFAKNQGIRIKNVYFGGGTPTSLTAEQLHKVLSVIDFTPNEYTVEAGRPDTITKEKLQVFADHGVDRISINPQTFNQSVLDVIGRKHSVQDIYDKFTLAQQFDFDVNMDLIAGLPAETQSMFERSVQQAIALNPANITVHTLALKHGSALKGQNYSSTAVDVSQMVEYAHATLTNAGYVPYYMYRQKYMADNLENVGFCKVGKPCLYNIGIMEEVSNILACGTNAISKRIFNGENRIERAANAKDVITYIERNQDYINKKFALFAK